uniref:Ig-like domain-containing protein n=1 Tax=uncultured Tenacibaculum sp. TaxID=174713 RepID=UPI002603183D
NDVGVYTPGSASSPLNVTTNDTTGDTVDPTTVSLDTTGLPAGSSCTNTDIDGDCIEVTVPGEGVWTVNPTTGEVVFTPDGSFTGDPTPITYDIEDAQGNSDSATITVVSDSLPIASDDNGDYTPGNPSNPIDVAGNDTSGDTVDPTTVSLDTTGLPAGSSCTSIDTDGDCIEVTVPGEGVWTVNPTTGEVVFTPDGSFTGDPTPISYDIEDAQGNSDSAIIVVVSDPLPIATDDFGDFITGSPSDPIDVAGNDTTGDMVDPTTVSLNTTGLPAGSSCTNTDTDGDCIEVTVPGEGVWTVDTATGEVVFTPEGGFTGDPTPITYEIEDAEGNSDTAIITITNSDFTLVDDAETTDFDTPVDIDITDNDIDVPNIGTLDIVTNPSNGTVTVNDGGTPNDPSDDTVTYTPDPGFTGTDTFTYEVCDNNTPPNCRTAVVTITVNGPENDVFNLISDDGNGTNGVFFIAGIQNFPNNTVEIFNRWGNTVYKASGYNNETVAFRGISNGRVTISVDSKLPVGTYYYVIDYGDESKKPKAGWLYINR